MLDIRNKKIGIGQDLFNFVPAAVEGRLKTGMNPFLMASGKQFGDKISLQDRISAGNRYASAGSFIEAFIPACLLQAFVNRHPFSPLLQGVGRTLVIAAQTGKTGTVINIRDLISVKPQ